MESKRKQQYHLEPDRGLLNDPNGLAYFQGKYYVFFQWNRFEKNHSYKEWGLFTSTDMIHWEFNGSALLPDQIYDIQGVYSGSGYVIGDKLHLYYTGNSKKKGKRKSSQCLAVSDDGKRYQKKGVIVETPEAYTEHFRDPKVWKSKEHGYFMIIGGQRKDGKGALALCRSEDGENWSYTNMLAVSDQYEMIECPDLFRLDDKYVLLYNPQKRNNEEDVPIFSFSAYKLVEFEEATGRLQNKDLDKDYIKLDYGFDFYAPQTFRDTDDRRIMFAWMSRMEEEQERIFSKNEPNIHCLTLPRELFLKGNRLCQRPVKELYGMLGRELPIYQEAQSIKRAYPANRAFYFHIQGMERNEENTYLDFHEGEIKLEYSLGKKEFLFLRQNWLNDAYETKKCSLDVLQEIEIWSDYSSIEIFINSGEMVFSSRIYPKGTKPEIIIKGIAGNAKIKGNEIIGKAIRGGYIHDGL